MEASIIPLLKQISDLGEGKNCALGPADAPAPGQT
jgi:hypothetical protein